MSGVYYFTCQIDGGKQMEHSSVAPSNPCPICHITKLEDALKVVLDCYAGQVPTPGEMIEGAKDLIDWQRPTKDETEAFMKTWMKTRQEKVYE